MLAVEVGGELVLAEPREVVPGARRLPAEGVAIGERDRARLWRGRDRRPGEAVHPLHRCR